MRPLSNRGTLALFAFLLVFASACAHASSTNSTANQNTNTIPIKPITTRVSNGYIIYQLAQNSSFSVSMCGHTLNGEEDLIGQNFAKLTLVGSIYSIAPNQSVQIVMGSNLTNCYVRLLNITYRLLQQQLVSIQIYNPLSNNTIFNNIYLLPSPGVQYIKVPQLNASIALTNGQSYPIYIDAYGASTNIGQSLTPNGYHIAREFNLSFYPSNGTLYSSVNLSYPLSTYGTKIVPFTYNNGNWVKIVPYYLNPSYGTIQFYNSSNTVIGLLAIVNQTLTGNTTVITTSTLATTSIPTTITFLYVFRQQPLILQYTYAAGLALILGLLIGVEFISFEIIEMQEKLRELLQQKPQDKEKEAAKSS